MKCLKVSLFLLLTLFSRVPSSFSQTPGPNDQVWSMPNPKDCGLITRLAGNQIGQISQGCLQSVDNLYYDNDWAMKRRQGISVYNPIAINNGAGIGTVKGLWPFFGTDSTNYLVAFSSGQMWYSNGNGAWTAIPGTNNLTASAEMQCAQAFGSLWCTDGSDPVFFWNGTSTGTVSSAPQGTLISVFENRLWIAGVQGNFTQLYGSGFLNGQDWSLNLYPSLSTTSLIIDIGGANDGQKITCLMGEFQGKFLVGRTYDTYALAGSSNRDWTLYKFSDQIGCIEPKSIQEVNNALYWLSKRGVEQLTGTQINPVSYYIRPDVDVIISAAGNGVSKVLTSQADWQTGNLTASGPGAPISATISPGDIVVSTWGVSESTTQFTLGAVNMLSTNVVSGAMSFAYSTFSFVNGIGALGNMNNMINDATDWSLSSVNFACANGVCPVSGCSTGDNQIEGGQNTNFFKPAAGYGNYPIHFYVYGKTISGNRGTLLKKCSATLNAGVTPCTITSSDCDVYYTTGPWDSSGSGQPPVLYWEVFGINISTFSGTPLNIGIDNGSGGPVGQYQLTSNTAQIISAQYAVFSVLMFCESVGGFYG